MQETDTLRATFGGRHTLLYIGIRAKKVFFEGGDTPQGVLFRTLSTLDDTEEFYPTFAVPEERTLDASLSFSIVSWRTCSLSCPISSACFEILSKKMVVSPNCVIFLSVVVSIKGSPSPIIIHSILIDGYEYFRLLIISTDSFFRPLLISLIAALLVPNCAATCT